MSQTFPFPLLQASSVANASPSNAHTNMSSTSAAPAQPAQQMAFQANAQLHGTDMSALLQNISPEQLAVIGHLFQTGQLQLPLQPPPGVTPSTTNDAPASAKPGAISAIGKMDVDKEEGEWEDGEAEVPKERDFLRPPPSGPRKRSLSPSNDQARYTRDGYPRRDFSSPKQRRKNGKFPQDDREGSRNTTSNDNSDTTAQQAMRREAKREAAKKFVAAAYRAGFGFDDFAREVGDAVALRSLFHELELGTTQSRAKFDTSAQLNGSASTTASPATLHRDSDEAGHDRMPATATVSMPTAAVNTPKRTTNAKPVGAVDRQAYLAKLQAAKNKSASVAASNGTAPQNVGGISPPVVQTASQPPSSVEAIPSINAPGTVPTPQPIVQPQRKVNVNNDLVRQRLEALRRDQAQRQLAAAASSDVDTPPSQPSSESALQNVTASRHEPPPPTQDIQASVPTSNLVSAPMTMPSVDTSIPPNNSVSSAPFPGLPGLFTTGSPFQAKQPGHIFTGIGAPPVATSIQASPSPDHSPAPASVRNAFGRVANAVPALDRMEEQTSSHTKTSISSQPPRHRPFQHGDPSNDDSLIIETSEGDESEFSDGGGEDTGHATHQGAGSDPRKPGHLANFPLPTSFTAQNNPSAPGTPSGSMTPGSKADRLMLDAKLQTLEMLKRQLAIKQKQQLRKAKASHIKTPQPETINEQDFSAMPELIANTSHLDRVVDNVQAINAAAPVGNIDSIQTHPAAVADNQNEATEVSPDEQQCKQEIASMEAQVAQLEGETGSSQQQLPSVQQDSHAVRIPQKTTDAVAPTELHNTSSPPSSDDAMDVSSDNDDSSNDTSPDVSNGNHEEDDDEDMYDPADLEHVQDSNESAPMSQGVTDATIVTPADSQGASDGDYTNAFLNDESAVHISSGQEAQTASGIPDLGGAPASDGSWTSSSESEDEYEPEPSHQGDRIAELGSLQTAVTTACEHLALPGIGTQPVPDPSVSRPVRKNSEGDLAPELQPSAAEYLPVVAKPDTRPRSFYTPYESPLTIFKDFRYHTEFNQTVPGGFKSLTYSNKLDSDQILCPRETTEGQCHDGGCEYQHFRGMTINDNELLKELGTRNIPNKTAEDDKRWKEGLTKVVQQLRQSNQGKDVNAIAARIAQFRREFVGKPDKVLSLEYA